MKNYQLTQHQIQAYAHYLLAEEKSGATVEKYLRDIRSFACWLDGRDISEGVSLRVEVPPLCLKTMPPTTVNAMLSALNSLLEFLDLQECRVKFLKIQRRLFRDANRELTKEDYQRLLNTAYQLGRERLAFWWKPLEPPVSGSAKYHISRWKLFNRARQKSPSKVRSAPSCSPENSAANC